MAHFARLNANNVVDYVIFIPNDVLLDENSNEIEELGSIYCEEHCGVGRWIQTSYNNNFRRRFAAIGYSYDEQSDAFVLPKPYPSWLMDLSAENDWVAPVEQPEVTDTQFCFWDEEQMSWITVDNPIKPLLEIIDS